VARELARRLGMPRNEAYQIVLEAADMASADGAPRPQKETES
jgi:hypothetical protein